MQTRTLVKIAAWGGLIVSGTGFVLQQLLVDKVRSQDYYRLALKILRSDSGAVFYLGEPIKDKRFKISNPTLNYSDNTDARFCIPVTGAKERGLYYIWAKNIDGVWSLTKAELELKSKPEERLVIVKEQ